MPLTQHVSFVNTLARQELQTLAPSHARHTRKFIPTQASARFLLEMRPHVIENTPNPSTHPLLD
jgi:hypothetical protein